MVSFVKNNNSLFTNSINSHRTKIVSSPLKSGSNDGVGWMGLKLMTTMASSKKNSLRINMQYSEPVKDPAMTQI